jgi:hypothetical protein
MRARVLRLLDLELVDVSEDFNHERDAVLDAGRRNRDWTQR